LLRKPRQSQLTALNSNEFISSVRSFNACALPFLNMSHLRVTRYGDLLLAEITAIGNNARMELRPFRTCCSLLQDDNGNLSRVWIKQ
jgi:hypothetical protein